jgi:hypothetical protein
LFIIFNKIAHFLSLVINNFHFEYAPYLFLDYSYL